MKSFPPFPIMTDHNSNKIELEDWEESVHDGCDPQPATLDEVDIPAGSGTLHPDPPDGDKAAAISSGMPIPNHFDELKRSL